MPRNAVILAIFYRKYACETPLFSNRRVSKNDLVALLQNRWFRKNDTDYLKVPPCRKGETTISVTNTNTMQSLFSLFFIVLMVCIVSSLSHAGPIVAMTLARLMIAPPLSMYQPLAMMTN